MTLKTFLEECSAQLWILTVPVAAVVVFLIILVPLLLRTCVISSS